MGWILIKFWSKNRYFDQKSKSIFSKSTVSNFFYASVLRRDPKAPDLVTSVQLAAVYSTTYYQNLVICFAVFDQQKPVAVEGFDVFINLLITDIFDDQK